MPGCLRSDTTLSTENKRTKRILDTHPRICSVTPPPSPPKDFVRTLDEGLGFKILPNPFRFSTNIEFVLPEKTQMVSLVIYDNKGKMVKQILDQQILPEGVQTHELQLTNSHSGMYFILLTVKGKTYSEKAILLK